MARKVKEYKNDVSELKVGDIYYAVETLQGRRSFGMFNINPVIGRKVVISEIKPDSDNSGLLEISFKDGNDSLCYTGHFTPDTPNWHLEMPHIDLYSSPEQAMYVMRPRAAAPVEEAYKKLTEMQIDIARDLARASVEFGLVEPVKKK